MTYEVIELDRQKYLPLLHKWYSGRKFPKPLTRFLPPSGFLCLFGGIPVSAGFLYKTDADIAVISNLISDPDAHQPIRRESVDFLIGSMIMVAEQSGFGMVNVAANIPSLMNRFTTNFGFIKTDDSVSHFSKLL